MNVDDDFSYWGTHLFFKLNYGSIFVGLPMHKKDYKTIKKMICAAQYPFENVSFFRIPM